MSTAGGLEDCDENLSQLDLPEQYFQFSFHQPPHVADTTKILSDSEEMLRLVYDSMQYMCEEATKVQNCTINLSQEASQRSKDELAELYEILENGSSLEKHESENLIEKHPEEDEVCESTTENVPQVCESVEKDEQVPDECVKSHNDADETNISIDADNLDNGCSGNCKLFEYLKILSTDPCVPSLLKLPSNYVG